MLKYRRFKYYYPPRPSQAIHPKFLGEYDNNLHIAQAKLHGSNCTIYNIEDELHVYNRHGLKLTNFKTHSIKELIQSNKWIALNGEYMNKSQTDLNGNVFNHKYVIFDIIVHNSFYLIDTTFEERLRVLDSIFPERVDFDDFLWQLDDEIFMVKSFETDFEQKFQDLQKIQMYEGLVVKKKNASLESGIRKENTNSQQFKFRKSTKNYTY